MNSWGEVYNHHKSKGLDPNDAAYRADEWEKRVMTAKRDDPPHDPIAPKEPT
jgi:hypothetical protein